MGAIERMEYLVRRYCGRRDAQGKVHNLAEDIRMSSLVEPCETEFVWCLERRDQNIV